MPDNGWRTIIEPFRIKSVEPLRFTTREEREAALERSGYNVFGLHSRESAESHVDSVAEVIGAVSRDRDRLRGYRITWEPPFLRHFTARFTPV